MDRVLVLETQVKKLRQQNKELKDELGRMKGAISSFVETLECSTTCLDEIKDSQYHHGYRAGYRDSSENDND